jgi:hypothetical protein
MAAILRQARPLQPAAQEMSKGALAEASSKFEALEQRLEAVPPGDLQQMSERLLQASERPRSGLQDLAKAFEMTSAAIQRGDRAGTHTGLSRIASEMQSLAEQIADQSLRSQAADDIADILDELEQEGDPQEVAGGQSQSGKANSNNKSSQSTPGEGDEAAQGESETSAQQAAEGAEQGEAGEGGGEPGELGQEAANPGESSENMPNGKGGNSYGGSTKSAPLEGEATALEVQLQKEALKIEAEGGGTEPNKDVEAAGERERSKLDYRNAPSNLTPAQKDLLNQDRIPWESRQLIKNYFQAVKPAQTK